MVEVSERELLAIIFTDAVGSSSQTARDEDKSLSMLMADLDFIRNEAGVRGGAVLKNTGDGLLISFKSAVDAVECALAIQKSFQGRPKGSGFQHKIGVHIGDVIKKDGDIYGAGVNTASRLVDQCGPGGICLSSTLFELTKQKSEIGSLKLQNFLLQNTEPPTLAYKSVEGGTIDEKVEPPVTEKKKKSMLVDAGILALVLLLGPFFIPQVRETLLKALFNPTQKYGFRFTTQEVSAPKSKPGTTGIEFTLENTTDLMLELKWLEPDGRAKPSDFRADELLRMSPKGNPIQGRTGEGHVFEICNVIADQRLGYLHFLSGTNLCLLIKKKNGGITVLPKNLEDAEKGEPRAQARLAKAFYSGEGVPRNYKEALFWAKKSSDQNCPDGLMILARMREEGKGVSKDAELASVLRKRAKELFRGMGTREAFQWHAEAAEKGDLESQAQVGSLYNTGRGVERSYTKAVKWYTKAANQGDSYSQAQLGYFYGEGKGVEKDDVKAVEWYSKAAKQGDPTAQFNLGNHYRRGSGVAKDNSEAFMWYAKAAAQGNADAQCMLGYIYEEGKGAEQDEVKAVEWYTKAAEQGNMTAQFNLGLCFAEGKGVAKDEKEAFRWYAKAAGQGDACSQVNLGNLYYSGKGVEKNDVKAVELYSKAAQADNPIGQYYLGVSYRDGIGIGKDEKKAVEYFLKAAKQDNVDAFYNLGVSYEKGIGVTIDDKEAVRWYQRAADLGDSGAQNNLGVCYQEGRGVLKDEKEAVKWYAKSAEQGYVIAQNNLGSCYRLGLGVESNANEAVRWYRKAAEAEDAWGQYNLGMSYHTGTGFEKNETEARQWFAKAAKQGHQAAKDELMAMQKNP